jgi:hypothetical protein
MMVEAERVYEGSQLGPGNRQLSARVYFNTNMFSVMIEAVLS